MEISMSDNVEDKQTGSDRRTPVPAPTPGQNAAEGKAEDAENNAAAEADSEESKVDESGDQGTGPLHSR
jgi:ribosomal protein L12E/L44/L45/RPP1/RPP2